VRGRECLEIEHGWQHAGQAQLGYAGFRIQRLAGFSEAGMQGSQRQGFRVVRGRDLGFSEAGI